MNKESSQDVPPFPLWNMSIVCCTVFASGISFSGLFPYVGFMVMDLMHISEDEAGYYAGYIASSMMIGRCLSSYPWGSVADRYGRKPVISIGLFAVALCSVAFGFSNSMIWALVSRFFLGLFNPVIGIAKTLVSEVALGVKQHEVRGMGMLTGTWGLGLIFGPAVGGLLSRPTTAYSGVFSEQNLGSFLYRLLRMYPYLIPNVITAVVSLLALVLFQFHFIETLECEPRCSSTGNSSTLKNADKNMPVGSPMHLFKKEPAYQKVNIDEQDSVVNRLDVELANVGSNSSAEEGGSISTSYRSDGDVSAQSDACTGVVEKLHSEGPSNTGTCREPEEKEQFDEGTKTESTGGWDLLFHDENSSKVQKVLSAYFLLSIISVMLDETVPLWALSSVASGGLFYQPSDLGVIMSLTGAGLVVFTIGIFPRLSMWLGVEVCYSYGLRLMAPFVASLTVTTHILVQHHCSHILVYTVLVVHIIMIKVCTTCSFTSNALLINQSVHKSHRATINGLAMSIGSCAKAIGPFAGAFVFAFSIHNNISFIDFRFLFILLGAIAFYASFINFQ